MPFTAADELEAVEGMLVTFPQTLYVTEFFQLGRFGEVLVSSGSRLPQPTANVAPGAPAQMMQAANDLNQLIIDDTLNNQNPDPIVYGGNGGAAHRRQSVARRRHDDRGDGRHDVHMGGQQCVRQRLPAASRDGADRVPDRQPAASRRAGGRRVADDRQLQRPQLLPDARRTVATTAARWLQGRVPRRRDRRGVPTPARQADRRPGQARRRRARAHRAREQRWRRTSDGHRRRAERPSTAPTPYAYVDTGNIGTDTIKVGIIYKPASVTPLGTHAIIDRHDDPRFNDDLQRPSLAQSFVENSTGEVMTLVVNHLKSKGCGGETGGDIDQGDGQGMLQRDPDGRGRRRSSTGWPPTRPASMTTTSS